MTDNLTKMCNFKGVSGNNSDRDLICDFPWTENKNWFLWTPKEELCHKTKGRSVFMWHFHRDEGLYLWWLQLSGVERTKIAYSAVMVHCIKSWVWTVRQFEIPWLCSQRRTTFWVTSDGRTSEATSFRLRYLPGEQEVVTHDLEGSNEICAG